MSNEFLINGEFGHAGSGMFKEINPADGSVVVEFPNATAEDANAAVEAADGAFHAGWKRTTAEQRKALFEKLLEVLENDYGMGADSLIAQMVKYYSDFLDTQYNEIVIQNETYTNYLIREPLGVVAVYVPVNSPGLTSITGAIPALAVGNTVVVKVPHLKVQVGLNMVHAMHKAGFPKGVVNVIASETPESSIALASHPLVRMVSFTGSTATGKKIMETVAKDLKRVHFNLGNKGPTLFFADSDWEAGLEEIYPRMFPGQACSAPSRLLLEESIADKAIAKLKELAEKNGRVMLIDEPSIGRLEKYVEIAKQDGELLFGGAKPEGSEYEKGFYFTPTAVKFENQDSAVCRDEVFGPLLSVLTFKTEEEAAALANDTDFGLIVFLWTKNSKRIHRLTRELAFGTVTINHLHELSPHAPWGGFKHSGVGKRYGKSVLDDFSEIKSVQHFNV